MELFSELQADIKRVTTSVITKDISSVKAGKPTYWKKHLIGFCVFESLEGLTGDETENGISKEVIQNGINTFNQVMKTNISTVYGS